MELSTKGYRLPSMILSQKPRTALVIFAKSPISGTVKTRMRPSLSETDCLLLHNALIRHTLAKIKELDTPDIEKAIFFTGALEEARRHAIEFGILQDPIVDVQFGKDLGERLIHALEKKFNCGFFKVIFIGTDSPLLTNKTIETAIEALFEHEVVIGPAADGGYYLIGFSAHIPSILRGVAWGTSRVYEQTLELIRAHSIRWKRLEKGFDVDTFEDLENLHTLMKENSTWATCSPNKQLFEIVDKLVAES